MPVEGDVYNAPNTEDEFNAGGCNYKRHERENVIPPDASKIDTGASCEQATQVAVDMTKRGPIRPRRMSHPATETPAGWKGSAMAERPYLLTRPKVVRAKIVKFRFC
jgi:hypothetical protein